MSTEPTTASALVPAIADDSLVAMYSSGMRVREIAAILGLNRTTVYRRLKGLCVKRRGSGNYQRSPEERARLRAMAEVIRPDMPKGVHFSPATEFGAGHAPWNKGRPWPEMRGMNHPSRKPEHRATYERVWRSLPRFHAVGSTHPQWRGGRTPLVMRIRNSPQYAVWRIAVYEGDGYRCFLCGDARGGNLEAHHIEPMHSLLTRFCVRSWDDALATPEIWDPRNGVTVCKRCHPAADQAGRVVAALRVSA